LTFSITLDEWMNPWLLKVGSTSSPPEKNMWISEMLEAMAEGVLRIVLDKENPNAPLYLPGSGRCLRNAETDITFNTLSW
jgi:hypothetical protein